MYSFAPAVSRKYFKLECLEEGQWEETGCEPISCPALNDVFQGMYTCTNGLFYDTLCTLQCSDATENVRFSAAVYSPGQENLLYSKHPCMEVWGNFYNGWNFKRIKKCALPPSFQSLDNMVKPLLQNNIFLWITWRTTLWIPLFYIWRLS